MARVVKLDEEAVRHFRGIAGISQNAVARHLGITNGRLSHYIKETAPLAVAWKVATLLKQPASMIAPEIGSGDFIACRGSNWKFFKKWKAESSECSYCMTITRGVDSYLLPQDMARHGAATDMRDRYHQDEKKNAIADWQAQAQAVVRLTREHGGYHHTVVAMESLFTKMALERDWIRQTQELAKTWSDYLTMYMLPQKSWEEVVATLDPYVPFGGWSKITLCDNGIGVVAWGIDCEVSYDADMVNYLLAAVERVLVELKIGYVPFRVLLGQSGRGIRKDLESRYLKYFDSLLRER